MPSENSDICMKDTQAQMPRTWYLRELRVEVQKKEGGKEGGKREVRERGEEGSHTLGFQGSR